MLYFLIMVLFLIPLLISSVTLKTVSDDMEAGRPTFILVFYIFISPKKLSCFIADYILLIICLSFLPALKLITLVDGI
jgi:hypothetical protein